MSRPIRVLELRSVWGTGGGPEKTIMLGSHAAQRDRVHITVCYVRDERDEVYSLDRWAADLGLDYTEICERHSFDPAAWLQLMALVRARGIDIIHAHDYKTNLMATVAAWKTGAIPLSTVHGWTGDSFRERWVYYPADKRVLARFPRLIAVSGQIKAELVAAGAREDTVTVVLNAIDSTTFARDPSRRQTVRSSLGIGPDDIVIGAVGRIEVQKRFDLLLETVGVLVQTEPRLRLVVAGDGAQRASLNALASRLGLTNRCHWLGHRTDVGDLHHAFDLFVQTSDYEGTPNAVLEAMAMETPIVATDAGGTRELAAPDKHALIVPPSRQDALARAVQNVLSDPAGARRRTVAARLRVETELSFAARTRRLEGVYEALVAERRRRDTETVAAGVHGA